MIKVICKQEDFRHNLLEFLRQKFPKEDEEGEMTAELQVSLYEVNYKISFQQTVLMGKILGDTTSRYFKKKMRKELLIRIRPYLTAEDGYGILTGVRPLKLYRYLMAQNMDPEKVLQEEYLVSDEKITLLSEIFYKQEKVLKQFPIGYHLYLHIPFCPTKCTYCSFDSFVGTEQQMQSYVEDLVKELQIGKHFFHSPKSIYIGGGTPSCLNLTQLEKVLDTLRDCFGTPLEFTVECGRFDTLSEELFFLLSKYQVNRISINPQTFNNAILQSLNRKGGISDAKDWVSLAQRYGLKVNMDLIIGLPGETEISIKNSIDYAIQCQPENITVHNLAIKKGSKIYGDKILIKKDFKNVQNYFQKTLREHFYEPYYLYRQKRIYNNGENMGYALPNQESLYNIVMMEELESVIGLGLGASTKILDHNKKFLQHSNYRNFTDYHCKLNDEIAFKLHLLEGKGDEF